MPLLLQQNLQSAGELGLWRITEPEDWFFDQLDLEKTEYAQFDVIKGRKRVEWLAVRKLVHQMSGRNYRGAFIKDEFGKPHLENSPFQISISHSWNLAAAIAAPLAVGIDIQRLVGKIERLAHKFIRPSEMEAIQNNTRLEHMHVYWGAKEALYKAYGRRQLDFCQHILVEPFEFNLRVGKCRGVVRKDEYEGHFTIFYRQVEEYILVYVVEEHSGEFLPNL